MRAGILATLLWASAAWAAPARYAGSLNLNQATAQELDALPGVGEKAAERIIAHRERTPFQRPEQLVRVKGFGKKKFEKLRAYLAITGPTTFRKVK
ncbi:MAG: ComEA family DNA-binding protein [Myxococcaceae bacterium]